MHRQTRTTVFRPISGGGGRSQQRSYRVVMVAGLTLIALLTLIVLLAPASSKSRDKPAQWNEEVRYDVRDNAVVGGGEVDVSHQDQIASSNGDSRGVELQPRTPLPTTTIVSIVRPQGRGSTVDYDTLRLSRVGCKTFDESATAGTSSSAPGDVKLRLLRDDRGVNVIAELSPYYRDHEMRFFPKDSLVTTRNQSAKIRLLTDSLHVVAASAEMPSGASAVDARVVCDATDFSSPSVWSWGYDLGPQGSGSVSITFEGAESAPAYSSDPSKLVIGVKLAFAKRSKIALFGPASRGAGIRIQPNDEFMLKNLDVNHYVLDRHANLYGSVPLVYAVDLSGPTSYTFGMLWLNGSPTKLRSRGGSNNNGIESLEFISEAGLGRLYMLPGPTSSDVLRQYFTMTGFPMLPPLFALGYHQCRWSYRDQADVEEVNRQFDSHNIPMDAMWLDIDHTNDRRYFTWDARKFPNSLGMIDQLARSGRRLVTITDPHIKVDSHYHVYRGAHDHHYFISKSRHTEDEFHGHCWPGESAWIDFANPKAREWYASLFEASSYVGSSDRVFSWIDMNEPSVFSGPEITMPMEAGQFDGTRRYEHRQLHNLYGFYHSAATFAGHLHRSNMRQRPFLLTRSFFAGSQRYAAVWTGDNQAQWSHLKGSMTMLSMHSLSGIVFVGADVGGFFDDPDEELHVRWFQLGSLYPFFRGHSHEQTKRREPWLYRDAVRDHIKAAIRLRYTLLPYLYTVFAESHRQGTAIWRPRMLEFPREPESYDIVDTDETIMIGSSLLAVPAVNRGQTVSSTTLPKSAAFVNYWTGEGLSGGSHASFPIPSVFDFREEHPVVPLLLRAGTILPVLDFPTRSAAKSTERLEGEGVMLLIALDASCRASGRSYHDDGETTDFALHGAFCERVVEASLIASPANQSDLKRLHVSVTPFATPTGASVKCTDAASWQRARLRFSNITSVTVYTALCPRINSVASGDIQPVVDNSWLQTHRNDQATKWTFTKAALELQKPQEATWELNLATGGASQP